MSFVLDSSVSLAWCFEDERTDATDNLMERVVDQGASAPSLWPLEVLNGLVVAERRRRIDAERCRRFAGFLRDLPVAIDAESADRAWSDTYALAERFGLTIYDAAYLELARRLGVPLATLDQKLRDAAEVLGISLLGH